jgi:NTP pyrophosphatase (non-canonical NTP hydrolase)
MDKDPKMLRRLFLVGELERLAQRSTESCRMRGWALDWSRRGAYLFLESAELVEALRGKGQSTPEEECADVLTVLLSIIGAFGLDVGEILRHLDEKNRKIRVGLIGGSPDEGLSVIGPVCGGTTLPINDILDPGTELRPCPECNWKGAPYPGRVAADAEGACVYITCSVCHGTGAVSA